MKILLLLIVLIPCFLSCKPKNKNNYLALLKGDWKQDTANLNHEEFRSIFCFEDSLCSFKSNFEYSQFVIKDDTILAEPLGTDFVKNFFKILQLSPDSLKLKIVAGFKDNGDTLLFTKLKVKNSITPDEICYRELSRFPMNPDIHLKIDNSGNFFYYGQYKNSEEKGYKGTLTESIYNQLLAKVQQVPLDSLKALSGWYSHHTSGLGISFKIGDKYLTSVFTHYSRQPDEIYLLLNYFDELNKRIKLQSDTSINENYFSSLPPFKTMNAGFDSLKYRYQRKSSEESGRFIQIMKNELGKIKDKELRDLKKQEIELAERANQY